MVQGESDYNHNKKHINQWEYKLEVTFKLMLKLLIWLKLFM